MTQKEIQAIDLMVENLHHKDIEIRNATKMLNCEPELDKLKNDILKYIQKMRA